MGRGMGMGMGMGRGTGRGRGMGGMGGGITAGATARQAEPGTGGCRNGLRGDAGGPVSIGLLGGEEADR
jgi:hypothetical protein